MSKADVTDAVSAALAGAAILVLLVFALRSAGEPAGVTAL